MFVETVIPFPISLSTVACSAVLGHPKKPKGADKYVDWWNKVLSNIQNKQLFLLLFSLQFQVLWRFFLFWISHLICTLIFPNHLSYKLFPKFFRVTGEFCNLYTVFVSVSLWTIFFISLSLCGFDSSFGGRLLRKFLSHQSSFGFWIQSLSKRQLLTFCSSLSLDQISGVGIR